MCEKDINKQQHCLRAFPGVPLFDDADKLAATGFADKVATGIDVVVSLAASWEATCVGEETCKFEFKAPVATV